MSNYREFLETAMAAAKAAGEHAKKVQSTTEILSKRATSLGSAALTKADSECETIAKEIILGEFPQHGFVGEEFGRAQSGELTWYVDPIDGTANYARQSPQYGVIIGLEHNQQPVLGVIYYPEQEQILSAVKGRGAWSGEKKLSVSDREISQAIYHCPRIIDGAITMNKNLIAAIGDIRRTGAGSVSYGEIIQGRAEIIIGGSNLHDDLAAVVLIREAGGKVTNLEGEEWNTTHQALLATNKVIHSQVLELLKQ